MHFEVGSLVKEDLETVIDKLYDLVKAGNKVTVKEAALALSLAEEQVETLAMILEESDLIEVQYTLAGSVLMPKKTELPQSIIPVAQQQKSVKDRQVIEEVKSVENVAEFIEKDFIERLSKAEKMLSSATSSKDLSKSEIQEIRKELLFLQERLKNFQANVKKIEVGESAFEQQVVKYQAQLAELEKSSKTESVKESPLAFLEHFIAFLLAWLQSLAPSGKRKQTIQSPQPSLASKEEETQHKEKEQPKTKTSEKLSNILPSLSKISIPQVKLPTLPAVSKKPFAKPKHSPKPKPRPQPRPKPKPKHAVKPRQASKKARKQSASSKPAKRFAQKKKSKKGGKRK